MHVYPCLQILTWVPFLWGKLWKVIIMGQTPKSQRIEVQNHSKLRFSNVDWCEEMVSDMEVQTSSPLNVHIYHMHVFMNSWKVNEVISVPQQSGTFFKMCMCKRISTQQLSITLGILGKCHIPYLCHLMLVCYTSHMQVRFLNHMNVLQV